MASKTNMSTRNQGPRLGGASTRGKVSKNPVTPKIGARIKNSQGIGGGIKQAWKKASGGSKIVTSAKGRGGKKGLVQKIGFASTKRVTGKRATKLNLSPMKAQPKSPKNLGAQPKNNFTKHNMVASGDVARMRKASQMPPVKMGGGGFKSFIKA
jgi:hypothetical protein